MIWLVIVGVTAGALSGLLGVGGGVLFVPGLVIVVGLTQHESEATSLLAIVPVALVGAIRQDSYGNLRRRDALLIGVLSIFGAAAGVVLANALSGAVLRVAFAALMLVIAGQLVRKALGEETDDGRRGGDRRAGKVAEASTSPQVGPDDPRGRLEPSRDCETTPENALD